MTAAGDGLAGLEALFAARPRRGRAAIVGTGVAIALHVVVGAALVAVDTSRLFTQDRNAQTVEMEVQEPPPPPPEVHEPPPPPPPAPEVKRVVIHHAPVAPPPPTEAPPPPSAEPPKDDAPPPTFGVSLDSTVGSGPGMAVPVGNTLMTKPHKAVAAAPPQPLGGQGDGLPVPVPDIYITEEPKLLSDVKVAFPPEAQRMGLEGVVEMKLLLDEKGDVRKVTITKPAGHGFDELAREAAKKFKFTPARTSDGKAVPKSLIYRYHFEQDR
ncbi:MAG TPA: energy transducer TonB [Polyangia bacterium]|nr:energy transducer TonB [Polyangia bacterium]